MAFWEKLSCQWLHCLSRIVVINFTRTWSTGALSWRRGVWAAEPGPLFTLLCVRADSLLFAHRMRQERQGSAWFGDWLKIRLWHPTFKYCFGRKLEKRIRTGQYWNNQITYLFYHNSNNVLLMTWFFWKIISNQIILKNEKDMIQPSESFGSFTQQLNRFRISYNDINNISI